MRSICDSARFFCGILKNLTIFFRHFDTSLHFLYDRYIRNKKGRAVMPELEWIGKSKVVNHHLDVPYHVLKRKYVFDASGEHDDGDDGGNMIIHGDNLLALKSLLPQYEGRVDCIYIDPPYNTGEEKWVYNDNVNDPKIRAWLGKVVGKEGEDLSRHDKWLCMMYPRLKLLRQLLAKDGAIFISIDDNEQASLKLLCDEIFGEGNHITTFIWRKVDSPNDNKVPVTPDHEYILAYAKKISALKLAPKADSSIVNAYRQIDEDGRRYRDRLLKKNGRNSLRTDRPTMYFPLTAPDGTKVYPMHDNGVEARWAKGKAGIRKNRKDGTLIWKKRPRGGDFVWTPYTREFAPEIPTRPYPSIWYDLPTMRQAKARLREIFESNVFDTPKPHELIKQILRMMGKENATVLDSFAGSGSTAQAVLELNTEDTGHRRFLLAELGDYAETTTAERVKRVIQGYSHNQKDILYDVKITTKNIKDGADLYDEGKSIAEESKEAYDKVEGPKMVEGHLRVVGTKKAQTHTKGTGGSFGFYELGDVLMQDGKLNENVDVEELRKYVYFTETKRVLPPASPEEPYLLGVSAATAYYFYYEREIVTRLDMAFLRTVKTKAEGYVIYADLCNVSEEFLKKHHIVFRKIPRDIRKL